ncbi:MAG: sterol desaturase family protein [Saprospiraceae bacterium]|nr:sterol desaturase family protein [Saprospiraceae bacterium]
MFKYVALSIPIFIVMIAFEALASWLRRDENYRFSDAITNLSLGLGQTVIDALLKTVLILLYIAVYDHVALIKLPDNWVTFVTMLLLYDFIYYWFHRFSHRINFLWAVHIVHHSSEDFNFTVALRQAWLHKTVAFAFFAPFPFLGVSPIMFAYINAFQTLYQFWLHTKYIGKLGPLEWLLVTPSHHRVHHSFAPEHLDKNFGGTLIVWDRLFGSFAEEKISPVFGITKPVQTWNPLWANLHYWKDLFVMAYKTDKWKEKIQVFFRPPDWQPKYMQKEESKPNDLKDFKKYDTPLSPALGWYIIFQIFYNIIYFPLYIIELDAICFL